MSAASGDGVGTNVCGACGATNERDVRFCGYCGAYLEWEDERVAPQAQDIPAPPSDSVTSPSAERASRARVGLTEAGRPDEARNGTATQPATVPPVRTGTDPARTPAENEPVRAVQPGEEAAMPVRKPPAAEDRKPLPGEAVCRQCGAGNAPNRKFCRRCGTDLADAVVVPTPPWYRRILKRPERVVPVAGTRPVVRRRRAGVESLLRLLVAGLVFAGLLRLAWPWLGGPIDAVRDRLSGIAVVNPSALGASSNAEGHPPALIRDGATNTYWSPTRPGDGKEEFVEASFATPFRLVAIQVFNGSSEQPQPYLSTGRVATMLITATRSDTSIDSRTVTLADAPGKQDFLLGIDDVTTVRLSLVSGYGATPQTRVALAEVAFFKRS